MARKPGQAHQQLGATLGPRLAKIVSMAMHDHMQRTAMTRAKIGSEAALAFFRTLEKERDTHLADLLGMLLGHETTHPAMEKLLRFVESGHGELSELLGTHMLGTAIGTGLSTGLANLVAPANQAIMYADPAQILAPEQMAQLAAAGIVTTGYAQHIAQMSGLPAEGTDLLIAAARQYPDTGSLMEMLRRGLIPPEEFDFVLERAGMPEQWRERMRALQDEHLSPADLALMQLRGLISEDDAVNEASKSGVDKERFDLLVGATGEPIALMQLLEAYRRDFIDDKTLEKGVRQSRVRDEWIPTILKLRYEPASTADAINGYVQNHISREQAESIAQQNGLEPSDFDWLYETAGSPVSLTEASELYNRGHMSEAEVKQALRETRLKDKYIDVAFRLHRKIPAEYQILTMMEKDAITDTTAARLLKESGYGSDVIEGLLLAAASEQSKTEKAQTKSEVQEMYFDHAIDRKTALKLLETLGIKKHNAELVLSMTDLRRHRQLQQAAMNQVKTEYVSHRIDKSEAEQELHKLVIPAEQIKLAIELWTPVREGNRRHLTEAQISKANAVGLIDDKTAIAKLQQLGYTEDDAQILLDLQPGRAKPAQ